MQYLPPNAHRDPVRRLPTAEVARLRLAGPNMRAAANEVLHRRTSAARVIQRAYVPPDTRRVRALMRQAYAIMWSRRFDAAQGLQGWQPGAEAGGVTRTLAMHPFDLVVDIQRQGAETHMSAVLWHNQFTMFGSLTATRAPAGFQAEFLPMPVNVVNQATLRAMHRALKAVDDAFERAFGEPATRPAAAWGWWEAHA